MGGYGIVEVKAILVSEQFLGLASSTPLVAVNAGIFGLSHVECIGILILFERVKLHNKN